MQKKKVSWERRQQRVGSAQPLSQAVQKRGWGRVSAKISSKQVVEITGGVIVLFCCVLPVIRLWLVFGSASNTPGWQPGVWGNEPPATAPVTPTICAPCSLFVCTSFHDGAAMMTQRDVYCLFGYSSIPVSPLFLTSSACCTIKASYRLKILVTLVITPSCAFYFCFGAYVNRPWQCLG